MWPWRTMDGKGLNIDLLDRVARKLGIKFEYRGMPWKRCLAELKKNALSGAIGASYKQDRQEFGVYPGESKLDPSKRLNNERYVVLRRKDSHAQWDGHSFLGLDGPVGIQLGYSIGEPLRSMGVAIDEGAEKPLELAQKLAAGRVAVVAMLEGESIFLLNQNRRLKEQIEVLPVPLAVKPYFLLLSHEFFNNNGLLAKRIWNEVEAVRNSAEYQSIERIALKNNSH